MIEPPQQPFERRRRRHVVGERKAEHREEPGRIDGDREPFPKAAAHGREPEKSRHADDPRKDGGGMDQSVGDEFATAVEALAMTRVMVRKRHRWRVPMLVAHRSGLHPPEQMRSFRKTPDIAKKLRAVCMRGR